MSCYLGLIIILVAIVILIITGLCCSNKVDKFKNDIYSEFSKKLSPRLGSPPGILTFNDDQEECKTDQNVMIQSNVAFRPTRFGKKGCTAIKNSWY